MGDEPCLRFLLQAVLPLSPKITLLFGMMYMRHSSIVPHWARPPLKSGVSYTAYLAYLLNRASIHPKSSPIETIKARTKITIAIHVMQLLLWLFALAENTHMTTKLRRHPTEACHSKVPHWKCWSQLFGLFMSIVAAGRNLMRWSMAVGVAFLVDIEWSLYVFDGSQMMIVLGAWAIWYLPENFGKVGSRVSYTSLAKPERADERSV